jgi:PhzF family phenazine biosynthesis protein
MAPESADTAKVLRYAAFTEEPGGGNPAGVVLDARALSREQMLDIAHTVGYSETAFLTRREDTEGQFDVRYFSPEAEVPFCGHATIAAGVALADRQGAGTLVFHASAGPVVVRTQLSPTGITTASLTSVAPHVEDASERLLDRVLTALRWSRSDLDPALPPRVAYAGAHHLILAAATRARLSALDYEFESLKAVMFVHDLTTVALIWRERNDLYHARNPFPVGGVYEDPATGAAAAAFGAYLRSLGLVSPPQQVTILQGQHMGRPSLLVVDIPPGDGGIAVSGTAVAIT